MGMANDEISSRRLGAALHEARVTAGLSRRETAARAGCTTRQLRAFERGEAQPDDAQMERLALACSRPVGAIVPTRDDAPVALADGRLHVGESSASLRSDEPPTEEVLRSYLGVVYEMRDSKPGARIPLRDRDLDALAAALGSDPEIVETRLVELMDVTREEAAAMRSALIRRRVLLPAASIALAAGVVAGGANLAAPGDSTTTRAAVQSPKSNDNIAIGTAATVVADEAAQPEIGDAAAVSRVPVDEAVATDAVDALTVVEPVAEPVAETQAASQAASIPVEVAAQPGDPAWVTREPAAPPIPVVVDAQPGDPAWVTRSTPAG
jgi:transcriptional regulator with XRE-family HTH domain